MKFIAATIIALSTNFAFSAELKIVDVTCSLSAIRMHQFGNDVNLPNELEYNLQYVLKDKPSWWGFGCPEGGNYRVKSFTSTGPSYFQPKVSPICFRFEFKGGKIGRAGSEDLLRLLGETEVPQLDAGFDLSKKSDLYYSRTLRDESNVVASNDQSNVLGYKLKVFCEIKKIR